MATNEEMTPRERWISLLAGKTPDRIPTDFWSTAEVLERLKLELECPADEALWQRLHIDAPRALGPSYTGPVRGDDVDIWGTRRRRVEYATGYYDETVYHPLSNVETASDVHAFEWPSAENYDYGGLRDQIAEDDGLRVIRSGGYEPFLLYCRLRGMEQAYADLLLSPDVADAILGHIFDFYYDQNRRIFEAGQGRIDFTYVAEDLGGQNGPLMSLSTYRRFLLPNQKKMADLARAHSVHVFYHTDGAARQFLPDLVDQVGIEVLNPIQWRCSGMEREGLVKDFGSRIAFHGAMDNQRTMPFGSVEEVVSEVRENVEIFAGSRWICAPCHNLQPVTPTENILALYETIYEYGRL